MKGFFKDFTAQGSGQGSGVERQEEDRTSVHTGPSRRHVRSALAACSHPPAPDVFRQRSGDAVLRGKFCVVIRRTAVSLSPRYTTPTPTRPTRLHPYVRHARFPEVIPVAS